MSSRFCCCSCITKPMILVKSMDNIKAFTLPTTSLPVNLGVVPHGAAFISLRNSASSSKACGVRASMVDSFESSSDFVKRTEQAWLISQQPSPVVCSSCNSNGHVECKWCAGTGFFILGDNMLCQVPSRNTSCVICAGKGSMRCSDCKGTGFRAKWLGEPPISK